MKGTVLSKTVKCAAGWLGAVVVVAAAQANAAEIAFTGGADGMSRDLSLAANWDGGELPSGAGVTGVVDVATFGTSYAVGEDAALSGLKFAGASAKVTIDGDGQLTLGGDGLTLDAAGGLDVKAKLATSADQTWSFGSGEVNSYSTISGTSTLTLKTASFIHFRHPPNYGGKISCSSPVKYYENGTFCDTYSGSAKVYFMMTGNVEIAFSTLFPGKYYYNSAWDPNTDWVKQDTVARSLGYPYLHMDDGTLKANGCGFSINGGYVRQTGGLMDCTEGWGIFVGDRTAYSPTGFGWGGAKVSYYMNGGEIKGRQVFVGMYYNVASAPAYFEQTDGSVTVSRLAVGAGNQSAANSYSHYLMGGGTLDVGNTTSWFSSDPALVISAFGGQGSNASGVFTQTNGTTKAARLRWGSDYDCIGSPQTPALGYRYALFELKGGRFELGSGGITNSASWHRNATNATYAMKMSGGTFAPQTLQIGRHQWQVVPSDGAFTVETKKQYTQAAPVWGEGTLRKTGSDTLALTDATRFKGNLAIDEGTVAFVGNVPAATDDEGAIIWSADDIAEKNQLGNGDGVENLVSTDGNHTFVKAEVPEGTAGVTIPEKVAISTDSAFAGHKSMYLHYNFLKMDAADNPLNGATNFTVVLVYRSNNGQWCCSEKGTDLWKYSASILGNVDDCAFTLTHTRSDNISSTPRFAFGANMNGGRQMMSQMDYDMNDNRAHVAIVSYSNNFVRVITDGYTTNHLAATATQLSHWRRFFNKPIYLGGNKNTKYTHGNQMTHDTRLAELRMYPTRAMTERECYQLGAALARKYGINESGFVRFCAKGGEMLPAVAPETPVATGYGWDADDLVEGHEDGAEITSWTTSDGETVTATKSGTENWRVQYGPSLCKNAINGHATVKFSRALKTALGVPSSSNPISGKKDFTLAVVFRTSDTDLKGDGTYGASNKDVSGDGIFGMRTYNYNAHDFGVTLHRFGTLLATWSGGGNHYSYTTRPLFVNDGQPHIAVLSRNGTTGDYVWMVDGARMSSGNTAGTTIATGFPLLFGVICGEQDYGYFEGEIAAARLYTNALTRAEMETLSEYYAEKYGMQCLKQMPQQITDAKAIGLGATNVTVAAGATLRLPKTSASPYTVKDGVTLAGAGDVEGSVRFGAGATVDFAALPSIEDVQIADGATIVLGEEVLTAPIEGGNVSAFSGTVTVDVSAIADRLPMKSRFPLIRVSASAVEGATFAVGGDDATMRIEYDAKLGCLVLRREVGFSVIIR